MAGHRAEPQGWRIGSAEPQYPTCPSCYLETDYQDDEFICHDCGLSWSVQGYHNDDGHWYDDWNDDLEACDAPTPPARDCDLASMADYIHVTSPCLLPRGHKTKEHYHVTEIRKRREGDPAPAPVIITVGADREELNG